MTPNCVIYTWIISFTADKANWNWDHSYAQLPQSCFSLVDPTPVSQPKLFIFNDALAAELGLEGLCGMDSADLAESFSGNRLPEGALPLAMAYAGHQFGHLTVLGDGRAILLGEHLDKRQQGYAGTTVDQICTRADVTKGAFFHYFSSKEAIARAAVDDWCQQRAEQYRVDLGNPAEDPLVRIDRLLDGLIESIRNPPDNMVVCLLGMLSQEMALSNETMRTQFCQHLEGWRFDCSPVLRAPGKCMNPLPRVPSGTLEIPTTLVQASLTGRKCVW